ncbi:MAG: helix-turn-helix domain-containing protein [Chloroflexota bacterium]
MAASTRPSRRLNQHPEPPEDREARSAVPPATPGERLRAARIRRKISLTEAEQATRIRARYLQALEDDEYAALPSGVYSRGFLRNYAIFLGIPPDEVMPGVPERRRRDRRAGVRSVARPMRVSTPRSIWLIAAGGAGGLMLLALIWLGLSAPDAGTTANPGGSGQPETAGSAATPGTGSAGAAGATPGADSLVTLPPLATAGPTAAPTRTGLPTPSPGTTSRTVDVELRTTARAWVRATVDGEVVLEETLPAGQTQRWSGQQSVILRVGNGAGVDVTANGQHIGALGASGEPADREFRRPGT